MKTLTLVLALLSFSAGAAPTVFTNANGYTSTDNGIVRFSSMVVGDDGRIDALDEKDFDVVCARALAPLDQLLALAAPLLSAHGICLFHKGARWAEELTLAEQHWIMDVEAVQSMTDSSARLLSIANLVRRD